MARLTTEEKAANKEERRARDQAYAARRKAYEAARKKALADWEGVSPLRAEMNAADEAFDAAMAAKDAEEAALKSRIAELQAQIKELSVKHDLERLNDNRRLTNSAYFAAKGGVEKAVDAEFKDIAGVYSAAAWGFANFKKD